MSDAGQSEISDAETSDVALMQAIAGGDESAFEALYDRYSAIVHAVCLRILRGHAEAEAVLSDVFWQVWTQAAKYNPERGSPRTYLVTLARSRAIDRWRTISARSTREIAAPVDVLDEKRHGESTERPERRAILGEERELVREAIRGLSAAQRTALQLAFFEGRTHRQIAGDLDLPLGTIKTSIRQGLLKLQRVLGECEPSGRGP
jgi:RNA polymerase sigma-70 factor (ECF subfamily)